MLLHGTCIIAVTFYCCAEPIVSQEPIGFRIITMSSQENHHNISCL